METVFNDIYQKNCWYSHNRHKSGSGADDIQTFKIREKIPELVKEFNIKSFLDCPCGDINYMKKIFDHIPNYTGADIVQNLIDEHKKNFPTKSFIKLNICEDTIPKHDLILCRDVLVHFKFNDTMKTINNIKKSGCKYLLTTTFPTRINFEISNIGHDWYPINLEDKPFNFPHPIRFINELCTEGNGIWSDKSLGLWEVDKLPDFPL